MPENENNAVEEVFADENNPGYVSAGAPFSETILPETSLTGHNDVDDRTFPTDNDGNYENYVDAAPYDGYAKRISHDTDNIAFRVYDHDYCPESPQYGVFVDDVFTEAATMVVGEVKEFEVRALTKTSTTTSEGNTEIVTEVWTDDIPGMSWVSEDTDKAIIVESNKVRAIAPGTVTIRIYNTNETQFTAKIVLTIEKASDQNAFSIVV